MSKFIYKSLFLVAALVVLIRCNEKGFTEASYPRMMVTPVTDISPEGAVFHAKTVQPGTDEVVGRGFVWGLNGGVTMQDGEVIEVGPGSGDFDAQVSFGLVKDKVYYVKAYVSTKKMLAYSAAIKFTSDGSLPPAIASISPTTGSFRDTVTIKGSRFSNIPGNNKVKFGEAISEVIKSTESTIQCLVPTTLKKDPVHITVQIDNAVAQSKEYFTLRAPVVTSYSPTTATYGDEVTITGSHFGASIYDNLVKFGTHDAEVLKASPTQLIVRVPNTIREKENVLSVTMGGIQVDASSVFTIAAPVITSLSVTKAKPGDVVTITGRNFNTETGATVVKMFGTQVQASVINSSTSISFVIPKLWYNTRSLYPEVTVAEQSAVSPQELQLQLSWILRAELRGINSGRSRGVAFALNGKVYAGLGLFEPNKMWSYSPSSNTWTEIAPFPGGGQRGGAVAFAIGNYGYVGIGGGGETDFWRYDPAQNQWARMSDFPRMTSQAVAFVNNGKGYVAISYEGENFWEYNPSTNTWTKKADYPDASMPRNEPAAGFVIGNDLYVYAHRNYSPSVVYRFNTVSNGWSSVTPPNDINGPSGGTGYSIGGKGYIMTGPTLMTYDPTADSWQIENDPDAQGNRTYSVAVELNSKVYFGFGDYHYDWWEFDPSYE
ncbi:MAG: IPT/TIG domain-containing protein [Chryseolinea sp.]